MNQIQQYINAQIALNRAGRLAESDQLTLGVIIDKLEVIAKEQPERIANGREEAQVYYDFEYLFPTAINSWRGAYDELALDFVMSDYRIGGPEPMKVTAFLALMKQTVGEVFTGYKGGYYRMSKDTPVWVANYGNSGNTAVIDIVDEGYKVVIMTGYREY